MNREGETPKVSIGFVTGLDYTDARFSVHDVLQEFKLHPLVRKILEAASASPGARRRSPRAATGRCPRCTRPAWSSAGDAGGMVNVPKLKGIHYAIESGRLAAETIYRQLKAGSSDFSRLRAARSTSSDIGKELYESRNMKQPFAQGPDPRRRDHQRDGGHQGPLPGRALGDAPRRRVAADARATATSAIPSRTASTRSTSSRGVFLTGNATRDDAP